MITFPTRGIRHLRRFREIAEVFIRYGFGELVEALELLPYRSLPRRLLRRLWPTLPRLGAPRRLRMALEELGPTFVKLGQVLSTRPDLLPPDFVAELARLQDTVPPGPWEPIREQIEEELGAPLEECFGSVDPIPLAAASLAQVHPATLPDSTPVVLKVQRPGIEETIDTDLEILFDVARLLQGRTPLGELYDLPGIVEEFSTTLRAELDFYREGRNADRFRENFAGQPYLHIPTVYWDLTTRRVLVLERLHGVKIDDVKALNEAGYDRERIALRATQMIVKEILEDGFFHADPHPGNFVVMEGEVIGAMDFGMVGYLSRRDRINLVRLYIYAVQMDERGVVDQLFRMGMAGGKVDSDKLVRDIGRLLRKYHGLPLKAIQVKEILQEAMSVAFSHHLRLPSELWLVGKTLAMMEGVGLKLYPELDPFAVSEPYIQQFALRLASPREWGPAALRGATDWAQLMSVLPRAGTRLLAQAEKGEFEMTLRHQNLEQALMRLDRLANRISLSLLLSALIVGLALLVPAFRLAEQGGLMMALVIVSFIAASLVGAWLILSFLRSGRP